MIRPIVANMTLVLDLHLWRQVSAAHRVGLWRSCYNSCERSGFSASLPNLDLESCQMVIGVQRRESTPERWQSAFARARKENVQVRQLVGSGGWIATSGTNARAAYELDVTAGYVHGCACPAASF